MHALTQREVDELAELREKRRSLHMLVNDHQCIQCEIGSPCAWMAEHVSELLKKCRQIRRIHRLTGIPQ